MNRFNPLGSTGFLVLFIIVVVIWAAYFFAVSAFFSDGSENYAEAGAAGDMFGGLTALFSGLAFAGLIVTLFMHKNELELQRKELTQTRDVFQIQRFENTLFGLIEQYYRQVDSIQIDDVELGRVKVSSPHVQKYKGKVALREIASQMNGTQAASASTGDVERAFIWVMTEYEGKFRERFEIYLGPYFRVIYTILRHINKHEFSECNSNNENIQREYSKVLRAHLSSSEVKLLMLNCVSENGSGLKDWIEKYEMLRHISISDFEEFSPVVEKYQDRAFRWEERKPQSSYPALK